MANYFVINNKFKPYSFDELIKPYQIYGQVYKEQEAAIDTAREKEFSPDLLDKDLDAPAYNMYNAATAGLQAASDELATKGLSSDLRGRIRTAAKDYKRTMDSLNTAQVKLDAEKARRDKLGDDYVFQQNNLRIGDFLGGASPNTSGAKLSDITKDIADEFSRRAATISKETWDKVKDASGKNVGGYWDVTSQRGLTQGELGIILSDDLTWDAIVKDIFSRGDVSDGDKEALAQLARFRKVIQDEKKAIGYDKFDNPNSKDAIDRAIALGATAGLQTTKHEYKKDEGYNPLGWANYRLSRDRFNAAQAASAASKEPGLGVIYYDIDGKVHKYGSDKEYNDNDKNPSGRPIESLADLKDYNRKRLAENLGLTEDQAVNDENILRELRRRGIIVAVIDNKKQDKTYTRKSREGQPKDYQSMIIYDPKPVSRIEGYEGVEQPTVNQDVDLDAVPAE